MIHLKSVSFNHTKDDIFPYHLPFFPSSITFEKPVTILVGENGTGKSTWIELIQEVLGLYHIKHRDQKLDEIQHIIHDASRHVSCKYALKKPKGFFFSAEDFTSYIHYLTQEKREAYQELKRIEKDYENKSAFAKQQARMPFSRTVSDIEGMYEKDLLTSSHGEAYLDFFKSRLREQEIYLIDEPETPLSIQNQLTLLSMIDEGVQRGNQFIIATHSPIMMAIPYADIYQIDRETMKKTTYDQIESVVLLKQFMNHKESFFRHLYDK